LVGIAHTFSFDNFNFAPDEISFLNRWIHTPRDDGKPRVLVLPLDYYAVRARDKIPHFIDETIKFVISFWVQIIIRIGTEWISKGKCGTQNPEGFHNSG
jgi:hypothetical protein